MCFPKRRKRKPPQKHPKINAKKRSAKVNERQPNISARAEFSVYKNAKHKRMIVEEQHIVTIAYELRENDAKGRLLERMDPNWPFKFYFGTGKLLPAFEQQLQGLEEGQSFAFTLQPEEAYGPVEEGNIIELPREAFSSLGDNFLTVGNYVTVTDDLGDEHNGKILSWTEDKVKVDFNHEMTGKVLHFSGVVLNVREATVDEHIRKTYIEEDGVRH